MNEFFKNPLKVLFHFTSTDRGAFVVLLPMLVLLAIWPRLFFREHSIDIIGENAAQSLENDGKLLWTKNETQKKVITPIHFDPNQLSAKGFRSMGFDSLLSERIIRYRQAGGKFRRREDLLKIWGMDSNAFRLIEAYIKIIPTADSLRKSTKERFASAPKTIQYDLNLADTSDFESVSGIGRKMAARIIRYRNALGGFMDKSQLYEVYGIDSLAVFSMNNFFISAGYEPEWIDLNLSAYETLESHPYLSAMQARAILFYRFQHGDFKRMDQLKNVKLIDEGTYHRIKPYIKLSVP